MRKDLQDRGGDSAGPKPLRHNLSHTLMWQWLPLARRWQRLWQSGLQPPEHTNGAGRLVKRSLRHLAGPHWPQATAAKFPNKGGCRIQGDTVTCHLPPRSALHSQGRALPHLLLPSAVELIDKATGWYCMIGVEPASEKLDSGSCSSLGMTLDSRKDNFRAALLAGLESHCTDRQNLICDSSRSSQIQV